MSALIDVYQNNGILVTTSRNVAEVFEKNHRDVLRAIRDLLESLEDTSKDWGMRNFAQTPYTNPQNGQTYEEYLITRDGFTLLTMGFTGEKALAFKLAYIQRFNEMERELQQKEEQPKKIDWDQLEREMKIMGDTLDKTGLSPNQKGLALNRLLKKVTGKDYFAIMGVHLEEPEREEEKLLTPTEIGFELDMSNRMVNQILKKLGFQYKPEDSSTWIPTEKGLENGAHVVNVCRRASVGMITQLKWSPEVIVAIKSYLE